MNQPRAGMTLRDLMVTIVVVAIMLGLFLPAVRKQHVCGRRCQCANNLRNIGLSLFQYATVKNRYPNAGTFRDDPAEHQGDPERSAIARAVGNPGALADDPDRWLRNWVVEILPYLDQNDLYNLWDWQASYLSNAKSLPGSPSNAHIGSTKVSILRCPSDPTLGWDEGTLSYVVNGGFARWYPVPLSWDGSKVDGKSGNGGVLRWGASWRESRDVGRRLGVMFLGTETGDQPWDVALGPADVTDGASQTLMVGENTLAGYSPGTPHSGGVPTNWACPLPNFAMFLGSDDVCRSSGSDTDCLAGQLRPGPRGATGPGWASANRRGSPEAINAGLTLTVEGSHPFANSHHDGACNFALCDGSVRVISETIDGKVYAELLTPAGSTLPAAVRQGRTDPSALFELP